MAHAKKIYRIFHISETSQFEEIGKAGYDNLTVIRINFKKMAIVDSN